MTIDYGPLTDDDKFWLSRLTIGRRPVMDWLAGNPGHDQVRAHLVRLLDRHGPETVYARVLAAHIGSDRHQVYAENWPRRAAKLAAAARERGDQPHADTLHAALVSLMYCASCGRPLDDPVSIGRGIGPDCWGRIDPQWKRAITERITAAGLLSEAS